METWVRLLQHSLFYGAIMSALSTAVILGSLYWNPEIWLNDYPPDVRAKYGRVSEKTGRQRRLVSIPFFFAIFSLLAFSIVRIPIATGQPLAFLPVFVHTLIMLMSFNLVDLLVIDWLVLMIFQPRFAILPGTEGMAGYRDYGFPLKGFFTGSVGILLFSLAAGGAVALVQSLIA